MNRVQEENLKEGTQEDYRFLFTLIVIFYGNDSSYHGIKLSLINIFVFDIDNEGRRIEMATKLEESKCQNPCTPCHFGGHHKVSKTISLRLHTYDSGLCSVLQEPVYQPVNDCRVMTVFKTSSSDKSFFSLH